eukprot:scaffold231263_cov13-Tisochrysis_lutea.AAC.1
MAALGAEAAEGAGMSARAGAGGAHSPTRARTRAPPLTHAHALVLPHAHARARAAAPPRTHARARAPPLAQGPLSTGVPAPALVDTQTTRAHAPASEDWGVSRAAMTHAARWVCRSGLVGVWACRNRGMARLN